MFYASSGEQESEERLPKELTESVTPRSGRLIVILGAGTHSIKWINKDVTRGGGHAEKKPFSVSLIMIN